MGCTIVAKSQNTKTGPIAATYAGQQTCPQCPFKESGCYAEAGPMAMITRRLNASSDTPLEIARAEAEGIRALPGDRPLRVHVVGDCATNATAAHVSGAMEDYPQPSWTYTHAWRNVARASWGNASVLASCETPSDVHQAHNRGYASCIVVDSHPGPKTYDLDSVKVLPCPGEFGDVQCNKCLLCSKDAMLRDHGLTIGFAVHGSGKNRARSAIARRTS